MAWWEIKNFPRLLKRDFGRHSPLSLRAPVSEDDPSDIRVDRRHGQADPFDGSGSIRWSDYNPLMTGSPFFDTVDKMRLGDGSIAAVLKLVKLPFLRTSWSITTENPDEEDAQNKLIAEVCQEKLMSSKSMETPWMQRLSDILLMFDYGYSVSEKILTVDQDNFLTYLDIDLRPAASIRDFRIDVAGKLTEVIQYGVPRELRIPAPYVQRFTWEQEGKNFWGRSILRPIYKHWFYKEELYRIDAVRLDRWGIGTPKATVAKGYSLARTARSALEKMLSALRGHDRSYIVTPEEVGIDILTPQGSAGDLGLMQSVNHHDLMQFRAVLAQFMTTGNQEHGNYGSTRSYADMFLFAMQAAANFIQDEYGRQIIKPFCDYNFEMAGRPYPVLKAADIQKIEIGLISEAMSRFVTAKIITPDDDLESFFRKMYGWPRLPKDFTRVARKAAGEDIFNSGSSNPGGRPAAGDPQPRKVDQGPGEA